MNKALPCPPTETPLEYIYPIAGCQLQVLSDIYS